jgi:iron-sulfur cluster insertion protein
VISISNAAKAKLQEILAEENNPNLKLRMFVQGGGCSGFQYGFTLDEVVDTEDFVITEDGITVLVDTLSIQYLQGAEIDYIQDTLGSNFSIKNPNATTTCGCGSSFSI